MDFPIPNLTDVNTRAFADITSSIEQDIAHLIQLLELQNHVWQEGLWLRALFLEKRDELDYGAFTFVFCNNFVNLF